MYSSPDFFYKSLLIFTGEQAFSSQEPQSQNIPFCIENLSCHLDPMEILASVSTSKRSPKVDVKGWSFRACARREKVNSFCIACSRKYMDSIPKKKNNNNKNQIFFFLIGGGGGRWGWFFVDGEIEFLMSFYPFFNIFFFNNWRKSTIVAFHTHKYTQRK